MSVQDVERAITAEAREVLGNRKLRLKDVLEWRSATIAPRDGETVIEVDAFGMHWWVAVPTSCDKRSSAA